MTNIAAILLCAGKGTRMGDASRNKVCFDCAGLPVIRRIVENMRAGGVSRFVVVVGHRAESVMASLDGVPGILYAYQKEQKGTGHATRCGLNVLESIGYSGPVIVSMGDKIVSVRAVKGLLESATEKLAVCGVQPIKEHPNGGHVMIQNGHVLGILEHADALKAAREDKPLHLGSESFSAAEVLSSPWVNTAFYRFDAAALARALETCSADNAQGEIYLTDTIAQFAAQGALDIYRVLDATDLLTYSTRPELRKMSRQFMRQASAILAAEGAADARLANVLKLFIARYGDKPVMIARAPGRVNLMGRHIEHRGGGVNVIAIDDDTIVVASPRDDDRVCVANTDAAFLDDAFSISECLNLAPHERWLDYLNAENVVKDLNAHRGSWVNYVKSAILRFQCATDLPLQGMDLAMGGSIPVAAGLSSSSSIVVAVAEAVAALNSLNLSMAEFVELCGEGEWFVGSRGGPGDHAAMVASKAGFVTHLDFKPFKIGAAVKFPANYAIVVADSCISSRKSEGSRNRFNEKVASYEFAFMLLRREFPDIDLAAFRDLAALRPFSKIYRMLKVLPLKTTRAMLLARLPESGARLNEIFATHEDPGTYDLRGVALYGISEIARSASFMDLLKAGDFKHLGEMMRISHQGDRVTGETFTDAALEERAQAERDIALEYGAYACSTKQIDDLCDLLNAMPGVIGAQLVGAGLGGCVVALVAKDKADEVVMRLNAEYYDVFNYPHRAFVCTPSQGASILF